MFLAKKYGSQLTINLEGVVDLHLSRRLLAEDGVHQHELVERQVPGFVGGKNPADPFPERILLKYSSGAKHFGLTAIYRTVVFLSTMTDETSESETHSSNVFFAQCWRIKFALPEAARLRIFLQKDQ